MATPNNITLHGRDSDRRDGEAGAAVTPGELLEVTGVSSRNEKTLQPHSSTPSTDTEGAAIPRFAIEGKAGKGINDDYAAGDYMEYRSYLTGEEVYAFLDAGESVASDDPLESAGNGALKIHDGSADADTTATQTYYDGAIVAHAIEAVDNSAGTSPVRIKVEVR